jgi:hypothetical protein
MTIQQALWVGPAADPVVMLNFDDAVFMDNQGLAPSSFGLQSVLDFYNGDAPYFRDGFRNEGISFNADTIATGTLNSPQAGTKFNFTNAQSAFNAIGVVAAAYVEMTSVRPIKSLSFWYKTATGSSLTSTLHNGGTFVANGPAMPILPPGIGPDGFGPWSICVMDTAFFNSYGTINTIRLHSAASLSGFDSFTLTF